MNNKKKALTIVILLFLLIAFSIVYIFSELFNEDEINKTLTDAIKFKQEYENLNGKKIEEQEIRNISIPKDNPMIYISAEELSKKIENKESFVAYFGFDSCPWCRSIVESLIESANNNKIDILYYVDIKNIRDKYELNEKNKAVKTKEGTEGYYSLLNKLSPILKDYSPLVYTYKKKLKTVKINEKRIYAPNIVLVKNGEPTKLEMGIPENLTDPYMKLTEDMKKESIEKFDCLFNELNGKNTCSCDGC